MIQIAARALTSDSATTIARFRPSKTVTPALEMAAMWQIGLSTGNCALFGAKWVIVGIVALSIER